MPKDLMRYLRSTIRGWKGQINADQGGEIRFLQSIVSQACFGSQYASQLPTSQDTDDLLSITRHRHCELENTRIMQWCVVDKSAIRPQTLLAAASHENGVSTTLV